MKLTKQVYSFCVFGTLWMRNVLFSFFPKDGKVGSGTGKRRGRGGFAPRTGKDLNENNQKATVTKEIAGKRIKRKDTFCFDE